MINNLENKIYYLDKKKFLLFVFLGAILVRLGCFLYLPNLEFPDTKTYILAGNEIFSGQYISNDWYMPLYPIYTYLLSSHLGIKIADIFISSLTVILLYHLSKTIFLNEYAARFSAIVLAVYPFSIFYSISMLTESLFVFAYLLGVYYLYNRKYILSSLIFSLTILIKPILFFLIPLLFILIPKFLHNSSAKNILKTLTCYLFICAIIMTPWWIHNYQRYDNFVPITLIGGYVLYSGNNSLNETGGGLKGRDFDPSIYFVNFSDPVERDRAMMDDAISYIKSNPLKTAELVVKKFVRFWNIWPNANEYSAVSYKLISVLSYGIILLFSIFYIFNFGRIQLTPTFPLWLIIIYIMSISLVTISSIRYRFPIEPILILFASFWVSSKRKEV